MRTALFATDIPEDFIEKFETIDYDKMNNPLGMMALNKLIEYCTQMPQRSADYPAKQRETNIPAVVLDAVNQVDYTAMKDEHKKVVRNWFSSHYWKMIPKKKVTA